MEYRDELPEPGTLFYYGTDAYSMDMIKYLTRNHLSELREDFELRKLIAEAFNNGRSSV